MKMLLRNRFVMPQRMQSYIGDKLPNCEYRTSHSFDINYSLTTLKYKSYGHVIHALTGTRIMGWGNVNVYRI